MSSSTEESNITRGEGHAVTIESLPVDDALFAAIIDETPEADRGQVTRGIIASGSRIYRAAHDDQRAALIQDQIDKLHSDFKENWETAEGSLRSLAGELFDENGQIEKLTQQSKEAIERTVAERLNLDVKSSEGSQLVEAITHEVQDALRTHRRNLAQSLDPSTAGTPMSVVVDEIKSSSKEMREALRDLVEEVRVREAESNIVASSMHKGAPHEDRVLAAASTFSHGADVVSDVSNESGRDGKKVGDVLVELRGPEVRGHDRRIVLEAKTKRMSKPAIVRELDAAMNNRAASMGLMVVDSLDKVPNNQPLQLISADKMVVAIGEDVAPLRLALTHARMELLRELFSSGGSAPDIDLDGLNAGIEHARRVVAKFTTLKGYNTKILKNAGSVDGLLGDMQGELLSVLDDMVELLSATPTSDASARAA